MRTTNPTSVDRRFSNERRCGAAFKRKALGRPSLVRPNTVERVADAQLPTELGEFRIIGYRSLVSKEEFVVLALGELRSDRPTLFRFHSQCLTGDVLGSVKCYCC